MPVKTYSEIDINMNNQNSQLNSNINSINKTNRNYYNDNNKIQKFNSVFNLKNNPRNKKLNNKTKLELLKKEINELYDKMQKSNIENYYNNNDAMNRNNFEHKKY